MKKHCVTKRSPGCGSQRLLRCRSHPAGRGPNSSSLLPPLAAVVAVASGLTGTTMTVSPTKRKAPLEVATPRGFFLFGVTILTLDIPDFRIPDPPQKSSAVQKVYRAGFAAEGRPVLVQPLSLTPFDKAGLRLPASASLPLASRWPLPQQLLPVSATGGGRRRCPW